MKVPVQEWDQIVSHLNCCWICYPCCYCWLPSWKGVLPRRTQGFMLVHVNALTKLELYLGCCCFFLICFLNTQHNQYVMTHPPKSITFCEILSSLRFFKSGFNKIFEFKLSNRGCWWAPFSRTFHNKKEEKRLLNIVYFRSGKASYVAMSDTPLLRMRKYWKSNTGGASLKLLQINDFSQVHFESSRKALCPSVPPESTAAYQVIWENKLKY